MVVKKLHPEQEIPSLGGATLGDFWSWAYSNVLSNASRGVFAEFLVASALGVTDEPRVEWDAVDLRYRDRTIEVKSSAYVQSWEQKSPSKVVFGVAERASWDAESNTFRAKPGRAADCYVFCLYSETDRSRANALEVDKWRFYVLSTKEIDRELGRQKSVGLGRIRGMSDKVGYEGLKASIDLALAL